MLVKNIHSPITTSAGRLFDGVAALINLHLQVSFEGQAAMGLEFVADGAVQDAYLIPIRTEDGRQKTEQDQSVIGRPSSVVLDWYPLIESVLADLSRGVERGIIAAKFHNALIESIVQVAEHIGEPNVALSGGCFQNRFLTERAAARLTDAGFRVLVHKQTPPNDGCISLGQVVVAARNL
jgi:hydrogenase maturation protein HypF